MKKLFSLKIYIFVVVIVSLFFLGTNIYAQVVERYYCSTTETKTFPARVVNCNAGYHVEGTACLPNSSAGNIWYGNTFNGYMGPLSVCGNSTKEAGEDCDDGNQVENDACNNNCELNVKEITPITLTQGLGDNVVYDDDNSTATAEDMPPGTFLKLRSNMPTPYLWVANSYYDGCDANSCHRVAKIRTFSGLKRDCQRSGNETLCFSVPGATESQGNLLCPAGSPCTFPSLGWDPSRTAVNVETGDVWIANRGIPTISPYNYSVTKLDINGNAKKSCNVGRGSRGLAIDQAGDVWVANYLDGTVVKILGDDTTCTIQKTLGPTDGIGGNPYGLAIDSNGNIWVSNRNLTPATWQAVQKITPPTPPATNYIITNYNLTYTACGDAGFMPYGITVDLNDDVWAADTCTGVWKINHLKGPGDIGAIVHINFSTLLTNVGKALNNAAGRSRGVTIDIAGNIWVAMDYSAQVVKFNPANPNDINVFNAGTYNAGSPGAGSMPIGIVGDSNGNVWAVNYNDGALYMFNPLGARSELYAAHATGITVRPYTYSDMTGLNRAMVLRSGVWQATFDGTNSNQAWGKILWDQTLPNLNKEKILVSLRASNNNTFPLVEWLDSGTWNNLQVADRPAGRYLQIKIVLRSSQRGETPVLTNLKILNQ